MTVFQRQLKQFIIFSLNIIFFCVFYPISIIGGINSIRSNSNWLSEILHQLTDQMRNFDAGQNKLNAKIDLLFQKVLNWRN